MKVIMTTVTGCAPNLPWWRSMNMTDEEIKTYNDGFFRYETVEFDLEPSGSRKKQKFRL